MGINVVWVDERGKQLEVLLDPKGYTSWLLPTANEPTGVFLGFVDLYGDTVFNQLQIPGLIPELEESLARVTRDRIANMRVKQLQGARQAKSSSTVIASLEGRMSEPLLPEVIAHAKNILGLCRRAKGNTHTYIKFVGD